MATIALIATVMRLIKNSALLGIVKNTIKPASNPRIIENRNIQPTVVLPKSVSPFHNGIEFVHFRF